METFSLGEKGNKQSPVCQIGAQRGGELWRKKPGSQPALECGSSGKDTDTSKLLKCPAISGSVVILPVQSRGPAAPARLARGFDVGQSVQQAGFCESPWHVQLVRSCGVGAENSVVRPRYSSLSPIWQQHVFSHGAHHLQWLYCWISAGLTLTAGPSPALCYTGVSFWNITMGATRFRPL